MKIRHIEAMKELEKKNRVVVQEALAAEKLRTNLRNQMGTHTIRTELAAAREEVYRLEFLHEDNQKKLAFFKWKVLSTCMRKYDKADMRKLMKLFSSDEIYKLNNSLEVRTKEAEDYKKLYEDLR